MRLIHVYTCHWYAQATCAALLGQSQTMPYVYLLRASHIHAWQSESNFNEMVWFDGKVLVTVRISLAVGSGDMQVRRASIYGVEEVTMVSPSSVFLCRISSNFFNLSGVPSPWLPITSFKTHSIVGVPPEDEDCTDSVEGGGKRWAHELHINMLLRDGLTWFMTCWNHSICTY